MRLFFAELMMVSSAMAVLPVWRSPMRSSRWPRPIGIMVSMALMPVAMGSLTDLAIDDAGSETLDGEEGVRVDGTLVVDRCAESVYYSADEGFADGDGHDLAGALDLVAFGKFGVVTEEHGAHLVFVEVHGETGNAVRELNEFASHDLIEAVDAGDPIAERDDSADFVDGNALVVIFNLLAKQFGYFISLDLCHVVCLPGL